MQLKTKLLLSACTAVILATAISNAVAYRHFAHILKTEILKEQQIKLDNVNRQIDRILSELQAGSAAFVVEPEIQSFLRRQADLKTNGADRILSVRKVMQHLNTLLALQDNINHATLIDLEGDEYWSLFPVDYFSQSNELSPSCEQWPIEEGPALFGPYSITQMGKLDTYIGYLIPVYDLNNPRQRIGSLILHVRLQNLERILIADTLGMDHIQGKLNGNVIWNLPAGSLNSETGVDTGGTYHHLTSRSSFASGITLEAEIAENAILKQLRGIAFTFAGITLIAVLIYIGFLLPLLFKILSPITRLYQAVLRVSAGNYDQGPVVHSGDELQALADQFNTMLGQIKSHIAAEVNAERRIRNTEYNLLLAQINPHFLYNTLNSVKFLSHLGHRSAVDKVVDSLIDIMQETVGKYDSLLTTSLRAELELVKKYLLIQGYQYQDLFKVEYAVDSEALDFSMPGFILQPLVENALFHGICPKNSPGTITIICRRAEEVLLIKVRDDGIGADIENIHHRINNDSVSHHNQNMKSIGLANIKERLLFLYGGRHTFNVESAPGQGFSVLLKIPQSIKAD